MLKAIFIAPSFEQARYWANQWGYAAQEWKYARNDSAGHDLRGYRNPDIPAFIVGNRPPTEQTIIGLTISGFEAYDGEDIE